MQTQQRLRFRGLSIGLLSVGSRRDQFPPRPISAYLHLTVVLRGQCDLFRKVFWDRILDFLNHPCFGLVRRLHSR